MVSQVFKSKTLDEIIRHVCQATGLVLEAYDDRSPKSTGVWKHLATYDPTAPPGRARFYLNNKDDVKKNHKALHGQVLQVGVDWLSISVHNDLVDAGPLTENGRQVHQAILAHLPLRWIAPACIMEFRFLSLMARPAGYWTSISPSGAPSVSRVFCSRDTWLARTTILGI